jgi:N-hydroxyarylamine O-acetyltransferase
MCGSVPLPSPESEHHIYLMREAAEIIDVSGYLARIGLDNTGTVADILRLKLLQRQHLLNVPFENLDIHWGRPIILDTEKFFRKIVSENRGGFCYELNGLFNVLLHAAGFETRLLSARVANGSGEFSAEYDHLAIMVIIGEMHYLADVGFGSFATEPLLFVPDVEQEDEAGTFVIKRRTDEYFEVLRKENGFWKSEYMFKPFGHDLSEFGDRCSWHQTSPDSHFTKGKLCSLMTLDGRKTLSDEKFIVTNGESRSESLVRSEEEFNSILFKEFGIKPVPVNVV